MSSLEENSFGVLGSNKWRKPLSGHELCEDLIKEEIWVYRLLGEKDVILEEIASVDAGGGVLPRDYILLIHFLL